MAYVTAKEVAKEFSVSTQTVDNWRKTKPGFPYIQLGDGYSPMYRYSIEDIKDYFKEVKNA